VSTLPWRGGFFLAKEGGVRDVKKTFRRKRGGRTEGRMTRAGRNNVVSHWGWKRKDKRRGDKFKVCIYLRIPAPVSAKGTQGVRASLDAEARLEVFH